MKVLARWCFTHKFVVVGVWVAALLALGGLNASAGSGYTDSFSLPGTEATTALNLPTHTFTAAAPDTSQWGSPAPDGDALTTRRAEPDAFEVAVDAEKVRDEAGNHLTDIVVTFRVRFPDGEQGDKARALLPDAVKKSHDRLCTVSRTVELGTPIEDRIGP